MNIKLSTDIKDVVAINKRSANASTELRIMELSSLNDVIPHGDAEEIRELLLKNSVKTRQLTNNECFQPWTAIDGFVAQCMEIRYMPKANLPINVEILMFDNIVAMYQVEPLVTAIVVEHAAFATQQKALFDGFWNQATKLNLHEDGSTD